jgi:hypothetical protein
VFNAPRLTLSASEIFPAVQAGAGQYLLLEGGEDFLGVNSGALRL